MVGIGVGLKLGKGVGLTQPPHDLLHLEASSVLQRSAQLV